MGFVPFLLLKRTKNRRRHKKLGGTHSGTRTHEPRPSGCRLGALPLCYMRARTYFCRASSICRSRVNNYFANRGIWRISYFASFVCVSVVFSMQQAIGQSRSDVQIGSLFHRWCNQYFHSCPVNVLVWFQKMWRITAATTEWKREKNVILESWKIQRKILVVRGNASNSTLPPAVV